MSRRLAAFLGALVVATTSLVGLSASEAQAAYCSGSGVGVVVDFGDLGGGVDTGCGSGTKAASAFTSAGFSLDNDPAGSGMVCRVAHKPDPGQECTATNAYWALFVSKQGGGWVYASQGVYTQPVANGDSVAFVWQSSDARRTPGADPQKPAPAASPKPTAQAPAPAPTKTPTARATKKPIAKPTPVATTSGLTVTPSVSPTAKTSPSDTTTPSLNDAATSTAATALPSLSATDAPTTDSTSTQADVDAEPAAAKRGLPGWVPPLVVAVLLAAAGGVAWARRAR